MLDIQDKQFITTAITSSANSLRGEFKELFKDESDKQFDRLTKHFDARFVWVEKHFDERFEQAEKYLDERFGQAEKHLDEKFDHHVGILRDDFNHKFSFLVEITKDKPSREEVREIANEESKYTVRNEMAKMNKLRPVTS